MQNSFMHGNILFGIGEKEITYFALYINTIIVDKNSV